MTSTTSSVTRPRRHVAVMCAAALASGLLLSAGAAQAATVASGHPASASSARTGIAPDAELTPDQVDDLAQGMRLMVSIPDTVLERGPEATKQWLDDHPVPMDRSGWTCAGAITAAIATGLIPPAKILKAKKWIAALGGVGKVAEELRKAGSLAKAMEQGSAALAGLAGTFLGIDTIQKECFS